MRAGRQAVVVLAALLAGCGDSANPAAPLVLYGNVDIREVDLGFRVGGRLSAMHVEEGDRVRAGDVLAVLDGAPLADALAVTEARVDEANARLERLRAGSRSEEVAAARAAVDEAAAALDIAARTYRRRDALAADGAVSGGELDEARAGRDAAAARLESARAVLALAVEGPRREDIVAAEALARAAVAERDRLRLQVDDTVLEAPSDGVVSVRAREPGSILAAGQTVLTLTLDGRVNVRAYVEGKELSRVAPGTRVDIRADGVAKTFDGQIGFVSPRAEFTPRTVETEALRTDLVYRLRIVVTDPDARLRQGMPVTVVVAGAG